MPRKATDDLIGERVHFWTILSIAHKDRYYNQYVNCRCDCGDEHIVSLSGIKTGRSKKCAKCSHKDRRKHGKACTPIYHRWRSIVYAYRSEVVDKWLKFKNFYEDVGDVPGEGYRFCRIDRDKPYGPGNTEWRLNRKICDNVAQKDCSE